MAVASNPTETRMQRRLVKAFIDAEPAEIVILRPTITTTPALGKKRGDPTPLEPQCFRLVPFKKRLVRMTRNTPDGDIVNLEYVLIGQHDADVQPSDYFEWEGAHYDVVSIEPNRSYRTAANITYRGDDGSNP